MLSRVETEGLEIVDGRLTLTDTLAWLRLLQAEARRQSAEGLWQNSKTRWQETTLAPMLRVAMVEPWQTLMLARLDTPMPAGVLPSRAVTAIRAIGTGQKQPRGALHRRRLHRRGRVSDG